MKDYRLWWEQGEDVVIAFDHMRYHKKEAHVEWDSFEDEGAGTAEQLWAIEVGVGMRVDFHTVGKRKGG